MQNRIFQIFRQVAFYEGISYLLLLFVAMPLKYFAGMPSAVSLVGSLHGVLFVGFMAALLWVMAKYKMGIAWGIKAFIASIIPFGTFYMEKFWKQEQEAVGEPATRII